MTALALIGLQVALSTPLAGLAGAAAAPALWARLWMDPTVPLIPGKAPKASGSPAGSQGNLGAGHGHVNTKLPPGPGGGPPPRPA